MAHVSYFRRRFVQQLAWLDEETFAQLNALCTLLPGPSSSQLGFAIGYSRAGAWGGIQAFLGFTLPSFLFMFGMAAGVLQHQSSLHFWPTFVDAMQLFAVVVVADASAGMISQLCRHTYQIRILIVAVVALLLGANGLLIIAIAGMVSFLFTKPPTQQHASPPLKVHWPSAASFIILLTASIFESLGMFGDFFTIGSSVFGGGHIMLPLLQEQFASTTGSEALLSSYALAQAIPGPMFTAATYIGTTLLPNSPLTGAMMATLGIFLPGFLLLVATVNYWQAWQASPIIRAVIGGVNPAMVALLIASLLDFIVPHSIDALSDLFLIIVASIALHWLPKGLIVAAVCMLLGKIFL